MIENYNNGIYQNNEDYYLIAIDTSLPHFARETASKKYSQQHLSEYKHHFAKRYENLIADFKNGIRLPNTLRLISKELALKCIQG